MPYQIEVESWSKTSKGSNGYLFHDHRLDTSYAPDRKSGYQLARQAIRAEQKVGRRAVAIIRNERGEGRMVGGRKAICQAMNWSLGRFNAGAREILNE